MSARKDHVRVLIVGGGVAALETLLALRVLAGPIAEIELLAPEPDFVYRPVSVAEPFDRGKARHFDLAEIAADQGARLHRGTLRLVDPLRHRVLTTEGAELKFDMLVIAIGALPREALPGALTFRGSGDSDAIRGLLDELERGEVTSVAFALPPGVSWSLPLYELALMTSAHLSARAVEGARLTVVTHEEEPLAIFGAAAGEAIGGLLHQRDVAVRPLSRPEAVEPGGLRLAGGGQVVAERVVALPRLEGPGITGLPHDEFGFIPTDAHGRVKGLSDVYAAGDATAFPLKQGGLATQQADAVADVVAARLGAAVEPAPFSPVLRGLLLIGGTPIYLRAEPGAMTRPSTVAIDAGRRPAQTGGRASVAATSALWWPPSKIAGRYLGPYLATARPVPLGSAPLADRAAPARGLDNDNDAERHEALELTLLLADYDARWGDYSLALRSLDAAEALHGTLPPEYEDKRAQWLRMREAGKHAVPARS